MYVHIYVCRPFPAESSAPLLSFSLIMSSRGLSPQILFFVTCGTLAGATALKWIDRSKHRTTLLKHQPLA